MEAPRLSRDERVAALYARIVRRVCERFEQHVAATAGETGDDDSGGRERRQAAIARVEEQWRVRLTQYTGYDHTALVVSDPPEPPEALAVAPFPARHEQTARDHVPDADRSAAVMGQPHALHQLRVAPSVFATMLSGKRKIEQLDGATDDVSDDESTGEIDGSDESDNDNDDDNDNDNDNDVASLTTTPIAVSSTPLEVAPATALNVAAFPLQCAARDLNFACRKSVLRGRVKNVIITLLRRVRVDDTIAPKHLLWLTRPVEAERDAGLVRCSPQGTLVEVVDVALDSCELVVRVAGSTQTHRVNIHETRRLYECVVASGYVKLRFVPA